ncbi:MAG: hypothetical protein ACR2G7_00770 [Acidimicrobiales bacterium]
MLRYLYRRGQVRGLLGGSKGWTVLWATIFGARMLKKATTREPKVVYSEVLGPGESLVIRHEDQPDRERRRKPRR